VRFFLHHCWPALLNKARACSSIPLGTVRRQQIAPNDGQLLSSGSLIHMDRALSEGDFGGPDAFLLEPDDLVRLPPEDRQTAR